jgi:hypothetical protein
MKSVILTAAAALLAGTALAAAQSGPNMGNHAQGAAPAPSAQQHAPADKMAPAQKPHRSAQKPAAETTGQAPKAGAETKAGAQMNSEAPKANSDTKARSDTKNGNKAAAGKMDDKSKAAADTKTGGKAAADQRNAADQKNGKASAQTNGKAGATTGQGAAGAKGAANLSTEQRTKIRTVIKEKVHARPLTNVNFSINVGTVVPRSVHFYPVPTEVVEVYPAWRGYNFILVNDEIVIIDPSSFTIVAIIA